LYSLLHFHRCSRAEELRGFKLGHLLGN
jgi:hypothetical protein